MGCHQPAHPRPFYLALLDDPGRDRPAVETVVFSPDRRTLAVGASDGTVRLWDIADPANPQPIGTSLVAGRRVDTLAFSPDGHMLASGDVAGPIRLWDITDPAHPQLIGQPLASHDGNAVEAVAFSPDGHILAGGYLDGTVRLWDVATRPTPGWPARPWPAVTAPMRWPSVPTGTRWPAAPSGTVRLWNVADPAHPRSSGQPLPSGSPVNAVAFSPDGHTLAGASTDGITRLWNLNVHDAIERICAAAGDLTPQQWHRYLPQLPYQPACAH